MMGTETLLGILAANHAIRLRWVAAFTVLSFLALWIHVHVRYVARIEASPTSQQWLEMEERFGMIEDELQGMWDIADTGRIQFSAWPRHERQPRTVPAHRARSNKRFLFEAEHAGKMLRRANFAVSGFPVAKDADGFDYWMSAIASDVPRESDVTGIGQDSTGDMSIRVKSGSIDNLVHASKFLCAKMAREESV